MTNIYLPFIGNQPASYDPRPRGFGIGIKPSMRGLPVATTLKLLRPPCWYNWHWLAAPAVQTTDGQSIIYLPGHYPMSWNPPGDYADANFVVTPADLSGPYLVESAAAHPDALWFIGNEPCGWIPVERMARHCNQVQERYGIDYAACGGIAMRDEDLEYSRQLRRQCSRMSAEHWHIYPETVERWDYYLERLLRETNLPLFISETSLGWGTADDARRLMEHIMRALDRYAQVHAVMWYVHTDNQLPETTNAFQLLRLSANGTAELTATGRHYLEVRGL